MQRKLKNERKYSSTALMQNQIKNAQRNQDNYQPHAFDPSLAVLMFARHAPSRFTRNAMIVTAVCLAFAPVAAAANNRKRIPVVSTAVACIPDHSQTRTQAQELPMYTRTPYQKLMDSVDKRHHELINQMLRYISIDNDFSYLPDWLAMKDVLSSEDLFRTYMRELEKELTAYKAKHTDDCDDSNLLPQFFTQWAASKGFSALSMIDESLSLEEFHKDILRKKVMLVDRSASLQEHGPWPHVWQWYIISKHLERNPQFLQHGLLDVYMSFADAEIIRDENNRSAWDFFFDSFAKDYTSPRFLTDTLKGAYVRHSFPQIAAAHETYCYYMMKARM